MPRIYNILIFCFSLSFLFTYFPSFGFAQTEPQSYLDTVVVTSSKREESLREVPTNITIIDNQTIENSTAANLEQFMQQQGFQTYSPGGGATSIMYMRGMGGSSMGNNEVNAHVLILLNGHRTTNNNVNIINLNNIERIEIIRGPAAVQYGSAALGGVVNIITKRGDGPLIGSVEIGLGNLIKNNESAALSGSYQKFDFAIAAVRKSLDDVRTGFGKTWNNTEVRERFGGDFDLGYTISEGHRIGIHYNFNRSLGGRLPGGGYPATKDDPLNYGDNDNSNYNGTISYTGTTPEKSLSWMIQYSQGEGKWLSKSYSSWGDSIYFGENNVEQVQAQITFDDLGLFAITTGIDFISYDFTHSYTASQSAKIKDYGFYVLGKVRLLEDRLIFSVSGRYDKFKIENYSASVSPTSFTPSIGVAFLPNNFIKLRANFSRGYAIPNAQQWAGDGSNYLPNPELKPQTSDTFEFGADVSWNFIDGSLTYFTTQFDGRFAGVLTNIQKPNSDDYYFRYVNLESSKLAGIELAIRADVGKILNQDYSLVPYFSMTWMTKRHNQDPTTTVSIAPDVLPYISKFMISFGITLDSPKYNLYANLNARYQGSNYAQDWDTFGYMGAFWTTNKSFTFLDLSVTKRIWDFEDKGNLNVRLNVNNLLDTDYAFTLNYPAPGRNFYISLIYNF
ncbi:MAG: TonB-dependent receptor [Deltaproteobacteria bacterium]|jgi:vitamin B12 transporter|nr:TonB-dependent receptor [Deltaproteobacteria bacterium]